MSMSWLQDWQRTCNDFCSCCACEQYADRAKDAEIEHTRPILGEDVAFQMHLVDANPVVKIDVPNALV
jgi:hypothetical protein